jgi:hypothetical protein
LILALVLMLVLGAQSCAVAVGGEVASGLSTTEEEKNEGDDLSAGGSVGLLVALMWLIGAALVLAKPRVSMWIFGAAGVIALLGGLTGFSDLYLWGVVSFVFALMSWRGTKERARDELRKREQYEADIAAAAGRLQPPGQSDAPAG